MQIATSPLRRLGESIRQNVSNRAEGKAFRELPDVASPPLHRHAAAHGKLGRDPSEQLWDWESRKLMPLLVVWLAFYAIFVIGALIGIVLLPR
jgi:hypothetical protein